MTVPRTVADVLDGHVTFELECIDRMYLNLYQAKFVYPAGAVGFVISLIIMGFVAGLVARILVPGSGTKGCLETTILGIIGSFVGGFLGYALFGTDLDEGAIQPSGVIGSIIGAVVALIVFRMLRRRRA
ncbi:MAG: GlsB/YeaQ/YmgE family stress response membrane protein [Acidimicrobiales bacterium]